MTRNAADFRDVLAPEYGRCCTFPPWRDLRAGIARLVPGRGLSRDRRDAGAAAARRLAENRPARSFRRRGAGRGMNAEHLHEAGHCVAALADGLRVVRLTRTACFIESPVSALERKTATDAGTGYAAMAMAGALASGTRMSPGDLDCYRGGLFTAGLPDDDDAREFIASVVRRTLEQHSAALWRIARELDRREEIPGAKLAALFKGASND